jgi:alpha-tubulin suppressor-like RCC1 family protein
MAATKKGVWDLQDVRDKQLASEWAYGAPSDPGGYFAWGNQNSGSLGLNNNVSNYSSPTQVGSEYSWKTVYQGTRSLGLKNDGTLWSWGYNGFSQGNLGLNDQVKRSSPTQIPGTDWASTTHNGGGQAVAVKTDGTMWIWGNNAYGRLGLNSPEPSDRSSPTQIPGTWNTGEGTTIICGNSDNSIMHVKTDGTLWAWGDNLQGNLALNSATDGRSSPVQIPGSYKATDGGIGTTGKSSQYAIKTDGTLWSWGRNFNGQLGINVRNSSYYRISSPIQVGTDTDWDYLSKGIGDHDTMKAMFAIRTDGTLWGMGYLIYGMLGNNFGSASQSGSGSIASYSSPVQCCGSTNTWNRVAQGSYGVIATKSDGTLWAWGYNGNGQVGNNTNQPSGVSSPVQIPGTKWKFCTADKLMRGAIKTQ